PAARGQAKISIHLLRAHVLTIDAGNDRRLLHGIATEGLAELLVEDDFDESRDALLLRLARFRDRRLELVLGARDDTLEPAAFRDLSVAQFGMQLGADEVVVVPERRVALLRAPLIVAEDDHRDARPFLAA